jgi:hypothetical protein
MKNHWKVKVIKTQELTLDKDVIENIVVSSMEGGSNHWMGLDNSKPEWKDKPKGVPLSEWATELILTDQPVRFYDREDPEESWDLNIEKLLQGVEKYYKNTRNPYEIEDIDGEAADMIVQYALFNTIVYS